MIKKYHISYNLMVNGESREKEINERLLLFDTQKEAINVGREITENQHSELPCNIS